MVRVMEMPPRDLLHHGLAIKRHAEPAQIAGLIGLPAAQVEASLEIAKTTGRAVETQGAYMLTPLARLALEGKYSRYFAVARANEQFCAAYERFEIINRTLKQIITDWQTIMIAGEPMTNDHRAAGKSARTGRTDSVQSRGFNTAALDLCRETARRARTCRRWRDRLGQQYSSRKLSHDLVRTA